jgi:hypothetical protein
MSATVSEFTYLRLHPKVIAEHLGKWIAVVGDEIVAEADSPDKVLFVAKRRYPDREPFIVKIPRDAAMFY